MNDATDKLQSIITEPVRKDPFKIPDAIPEGSRNNTLVRFASSLRADGMDYGEILAALQIVNQRCIPPYPEDRLQEIAANRAKARTLNLRKKPKNNDKNEELPRTAYLEKDGRLYLTVIDEQHQYHFACFEDGNIRFVPNVDGKFPRQLPVVDGNIVPVVGLPKKELLKQAPAISAPDLYTLIKKHLLKYIDAPDSELELFIYYIIFTSFYRKCNTVPYLRLISDTGKGKSRILTVISDLCFYPVRASGSSSVSGIMRFQEQWHGTLQIDEADLSRGGIDSPLIKYLNLGFEKDKLYLLTNKENVNEIQIFDPFSPKIIAMREPFRDNATEGRCLSFSPKETRKPDIPILLPASYPDEVDLLRAQISRFVLEHWQAVDGQKMIDPVDLPKEARLKQLALPLSIVLQLFPDGETRFRLYLSERQKEIRQDRANSWEGSLFNYVYDRANNADEEPLLHGDYAVNAVTPTMIKEGLGLKSPQLAVTGLKSIGFTVERECVLVAPNKDSNKTRKLTIKKLVVPDTNVWREITDRYYASNNGTHIECPDMLRSEKWVPEQKTIPEIYPEGETNAAI